MTKPLSENALALYDRLYLVKHLGETSPDQAHRRVARFAASAETDTKLQEKYEYEFFRMMEDNQFRPNTPTFMNAGVHDKPQTSACFVGELLDDMNSILDFHRDSAIIYKSGSGIGGNYGLLREKDAPLSTGGCSSGPTSYMRLAAMNAHAVKSGGSCLSPYQPVFTNLGIKPIQELVGQDFAILSYDKKEHRFKAKKATAFMKGRKTVYVLKTDKGDFQLTKDHPVLLSTGNYVEVQNLKPGMSLQKFHTSNRQDYVRVQLWDGKKGRRTFHRMIAEDVYAIPADMIVHHKDANKSNNDFENLQFVRPTKHASIHSQALVDAGSHPFQTQYWGQPGSENPMHREADFWKDKEKVEAYKEKQRQNIYKNPKSNIKRARLCHKTSMIKRVYDLINAGAIDRDFSFEDLLRARRIKWGRSGASKERQLASIIGLFGSFDRFKEAICENNHTVVSISKLDQMPVYDIQVACNSRDDLGPYDSHNFGICPIGATGFYGEGIVVHNSRRAAHMAMFTDTHPDLQEFIHLKAQSDEFVILPSGEKTPLFSAMNLSVAISDKFMEAVCKDEDWNLVGVVDGKVKSTHRAREIYKQITYNAWRNGDPGIWFIDRANKDNTVSSMGRIVSSNPCGEQHLLPRQSCALGSINVAAFVEPAGKLARFQWKQFSETVTLANRFLDNCIDLSGFPTPEYEKMAKLTRPIGLGIMGLADALILMNIRYGSEEAISFAQRLAKTLTAQAIIASAALAAEKGAFPLINDNEHTIMNVVGKFIDDPEQLDSINQTGLRNSQWTTIAPTGSTSISCDCSQGMEPLFAICYDKHLSDNGGVWAFVNPIFEQRFSKEPWYPEAIKAIVKNHGSLRGLGLPPETDVFVCAHDIHWQNRIDMQSALQKGITNAISSTINLPQSATVEEIGEIYMKAWEAGLKGITVYRDGCLKNQPVNFGQKEQEQKPEQKPQPEPPKRPKVRHGYTHEVNTGHGKIYLTINCAPDGQPMEIFTNGGKNGSVNAANLEAMARLVSIALQEGVSPFRLARTIENINDGTVAWDRLDESDPKPIPIISVPDAIGKVLRRFYCHDKQSASDAATTEETSVERRCELCNSPMYMHDGCEFCPNCGSKCG